VGLSLDYANCAVFPKIHNACLHRKKGIIGTPSYVKAGLERSAALPNKNAARGYKLAVKTLYAQALRIAISTVTSTP